MKGFFGKITGILVGIMAALFGVSATNVAASVPDINSEKKALYLEHGKSVSRNPGDMRAMTHYSHMSHESSAKIQKGQTDKMQKAPSVQNKAKVNQKVNVKETNKKPVSAK